MPQKAVTEVLSFCANVLRKKAVTYCWRGQRPKAVTFIKPVRKSINLRKTAVCTEISEVQCSIFETIALHCALRGNVIVNDSKQIVEEIWSREWSTSTCRVVRKWYY